MEKEGGREVGGWWDGRIWFGVADEVDADDDDKTQSRQSLFFLPLACLPSPPSLLHHPSFPRSALFCPLCLCSLHSVVSIHMEQRAAAASVRAPFAVSDGAEKDERANHSHFEKMRAAPRITSRLPSLRRSEAQK